MTIYLRCPRNIDGFPVGENMRRIISMSHKTEISWAFFNIPALRLPYVTCLLLRLSNLCIFNFTLPILQMQVKIHSLRLLLDPTPLITTLQLITYPIIALDNIDKKST